MSVEEKQVTRHRITKGALGTFSVLLLVLTALRLFGAFSQPIDDSAQYSLQLVLVALVLLFSFLVQRSGDALRELFAARVDAEKDAGGVSLAPEVFLPAGAEYERSVKQYKVVAWSAVTVIAASFVLVPLIGDRIMSSGAPFEAFNLLMIAAGVIVIVAAATAKYFSWKMRKAGRDSVSAQQEAAS